MQTYNDRKKQAYMVYLLTVVLAFTIAALVTFSGCADDTVSVKKPAEGCVTYVIIDYLYEGRVHHREYNTAKQVIEEGTLTIYSEGNEPLLSVPVEDVINYSNQEYSVYKIRLEIFIEGDEEEAYQTLSVVASDLEAAIAAAKEHAIAEEIEIAKVNGNENPTIKYCKLQEAKIEVESIDIVLK